MYESLINPAFTVCLSSIWRWDCASWAGTYSKLLLLSVAVLQSPPQSPSDSPWLFPPYSWRGYCLPWSNRQHMTMKPPHVLGDYCKMATATRSCVPADLSCTILLSACFTLYFGQFLNFLCRRFNVTFALNSTMLQNCCYPISRRWNKSIWRWPFTTLCLCRLFTRAISLTPYLSCFPKPYICYPF